MDIVVEKKVGLGFLGDKYEESYLILNCIPVKDYDLLQSEAKEAAKKGTSFKYIQEKIKEQLVSGKIQQGEAVVDLNQDNIQLLPGEVFFKAYESITGQISPN